MSLELRIDRLTERDLLLGSFSCGSGRGARSLEQFLTAYALVNQRRQQSATWLARTEGELVGYVTVAPGSIEAPAIDAHVADLPRYPTPILLLARMAVQSGFQKRGIGRALIRHVFVEACALADRFGCVGVCVDPKGEAEGYYERFGFRAIASAGRPRLFLPLATVRAAMAATA